MSSIAELRKRVKELRVSIVGAVGSASEEELKREIAYHESAAKLAERDVKRGEALAKARATKIAKGKAKKEGTSSVVVPVAPAPKAVKVPKAPAPPKEPKVVKEPKEPKPPKVPKAEVEAMVAKAIPKAEKMAKAQDEAVLAKHIRAKKSKDAEEADE
jgi:hypothetical protein